MAFGILPARNDVAFPQPFPPTPPMPLPDQRIAWMISFGLIVAACAGCNTGKPSQPDTQTVEKPVSTEEKWGAIVLQGEKIGHMREKIEHLTHDGNAYVRTTQVKNMTIQRAGQPLELKVEDVFLETPSGFLKQFITKMGQGGAVTRFTGQVSADGQTLQLTTQSGTSPRISESIDWKPEYGGVHAVQRMLEASPLEVGETRTVMALMPTVNRVAKQTVTGLGNEEVTMIDGSQVSLLKARQVMEAEGQSPFESLVWLNADGEIVKTKSVGQEFEIYKCPKQYALSPNKAVSFDLALDTIVPVEGMPKENFDQLESMAYEVFLKNSDPSQLFVSGANQEVTKIDDRHAKLHVWRIEPNGELPMALANASKPTEADRAASPLVQVNDPVIQRLASQAAIPSGDTASQAMALEKFVHQTIEEKNFSQGFLSAAEVAQVKTGDCTEHAVLLMALLRAKGIPSRGALGLVYVDYGEKKGFAYHMWTEAWIGDRWLPLDATRGQGGIGVNYIKVTQSDLSGSGAFAAFLPVSQVIGQLEIRVAD